MHGARDDGRRVVAGPRGTLLARDRRGRGCLALGACGSDLGSEDEGEASEVQVADTEPVEGEPLTISSAVLYIDKSEGAVDGPGSTLANFTEETGIEVEYLEEINSNESHFAKLRPELENGSSGGRDLIVATDWMARKYYDLGYLAGARQGGAPERRGEPAARAAEPRVRPRAQLHRPVPERDDRV